MKRIMQDFIIDQHNRGNLLFLGDVNEIISYLDDINEDVLYKSDFHGLHHSQKVCFFAYLIGKYEKLDNEDMMILMDAARYHDIGRENDNEEDFHGLVSARRIDKVVKYDNPINMYYLKAIVEAHNKDDGRNIKVFTDWSDELSMDERKLEPMLFERFVKLCDILKDADALDRLRFRNCPAVLDEEYLRSEYSKKLIDLSKIINDYYYEIEVEAKYKELKDSYELNTYRKSLCYHSIGFDFFKGLGILKNGVLSHYRANKDGIKISRNFNGNNGEFWISVVDADPECLNEAYDRYVKNGISFLCHANELVPGVIRAKDNGSFDPRISDEYHDEKFVFDKIPVEDIQYISIPKNLLNTSIRELQYLYCNSQYDLIKTNVNNYLNEIEEYCDIKINRVDFNEILSDLEKEQIKFNNYSKFEAMVKAKNYFQMINHMKEQINIYLQHWMQIGFAELMDKTFDETITLGEVLKYILNSANIEYEFVEDLSSDGEKYYPFLRDNNTVLLELKTFNKSALNSDVFTRIKEI